jgi:hypothetical protein
MNSVVKMRSEIAIGAVETILGAEAHQPFQGH